MLQEVRNAVLTSKSLSGDHNLSSHAEQSPRPSHPIPLAPEASPLSCQFSFGPVSSTCWELAVYMEWIRKFCSSWARDQKATQIACSSTSLINLQHVFAHAQQPCCNKPFIRSADMPFLAAQLVALGLFFLVSPMGPPPLTMMRLRSKLAFLRTSAVLTVSAPLPVLFVCLFVFCCVLFCCVCFLHPCLEHLRLG